MNTKKIFGENPSLDQIALPKLPYPSFSQEGTACPQMAGRARIGMPAEKRPAAYELINSLNEDELVQCYLDEKGNLTACQILVLADSVLSEKMVISTLGYIWKALEAGFEPLMKLRYS